MDHRHVLLVDAMLLRARRQTVSARGSEMYQRWLSPDREYRVILFLLGEVCDFFSGNPNLNVALSSSMQHNVVASVGIGLRF